MRDVIILLIIVVVIAIVASMAGRQDMLEEIEDKHKTFFCDACHIEEGIK